MTEDLSDDWGDVRHRRAIQDLDSCPPFPDLDHLIIRHLVETFGDGADDVNRESISGLSNPMWWKLKTSRWRGAVYVDEGGQAWLCAAGLRREGEITDFYKAFSADVSTVAGVFRILPTGDDYARLARECAEELLAGWESRLHQSAVEALSVASDGPLSAFDIPDIASEAVIGRASIEVVRIGDGYGDEEDSIAEIVLSVMTEDWSRVDALNRAEIVLMAAICPNEQSWIPGHTGSEHIYSIAGTVDDVDAIIGSAGDSSRVPGMTAPGTKSHYAHKGRLTENYIEGTGTRALCGVYFVPRQAPDGLERCEVCDAVYKSLPA